MKRSTSYRAPLRLHIYWIHRRDYYSDRNRKAAAQCRNILEVASFESTGVGQRLVAQPTHNGRIADALFIARLMRLPVSLRHRLTQRRGV